MNRHERRAHGALTDTAKLRSGAPGMEIETYPAAPGDVVLYRSLPVLKMTRDDIEHRKMEARVMHGAHINRERRKPASVGARAPETPRGERDQSAIEAGVWPVWTP